MDINEKQTCSHRAIAISNLQIFDEILYKIFLDISLNYYQ